MVASDGPPARQKIPIKVDPHPKDTKWLEDQLEDALADVIFGNQTDYPILRRVADVVAVKVLEPGETWQIVPDAEPAAAGEELEPEEAYIPLDRKQMAQAQRILRIATASPMLKAEQLYLCPQTGAVVGWIRTAGWSGPTEISQAFSHVVTQKSVRYILG